MLGACAAWALISEERILRQQIALQLRVSSKEAYKVNQEAVTADEKETDIRLQSTGSDQEAVIELKVGEKDRSAADLLSALNEQLVVKYMAPESRRAGCFLITINSDRTWRHPDTGNSLDLRGLISMLNGEAAWIEEKMGRALRITVRGLDLRPVLATENKRTKVGEPAQMA